jgi:hypothetical protein
MSMFFFKIHLCTNFSPPLFFSPFLLLNALDHRKYIIIESLRINHVDRSMSMMNEANHEMKKS